MYSDLMYKNNYYESAGILFLVSIAPSVVDLSVQSVSA